jgi:hypothetical protein
MGEQTIIDRQTLAGSAEWFADLESNALAGPRPPLWKPISGTGFLMD